jgi:MFS family permease
MNLGFLTKELKVPRKQLAAVTLLTSGSLAWFLFLEINVSEVFKTITQNNYFWVYYNVGQTLFFGFAIIGIFVGIFLRKFDHRRLLALWIFLGTFATIFVTLFQGTIFATASSLLLGLSFGFGLPTCLALVGECTVMEERARVAGLIILCTFIIVFSGMLVATMLDIGIIVTFLLFAALRSISFLGLIIDKCKIQREDENEKTRLPSTAYREFIFYLIPWAMFQIVGSSAGNLIPSTPDYASAIAIGSVIRYIFIALFGLVSGVVADRFGRKTPIIAGLIMLAISVILLGYAKSPTSVLIYLPVSGIAWGSFFAIYLAIPGDLSVPGYRRKFYGLEYILLLVIFFSFSLLPGGQLFATNPANSFALILSAILFLSIVPVLRANETLSGKKIAERKMKDHLDKIEKLIKETK